MMRCPLCARPFLRGGPGDTTMTMSQYHENCLGCGVPTDKQMLVNGYCKEGCAKTRAGNSTLADMRLVG